VPRHKEGHPHLLPTHADHGGAHLGPEQQGRRRAGLVTLVVVGVVVLGSVGLAFALDRSGAKEDRTGRAAAGSTASATPRGSVSPSASGGASTASGSSASGSTSPSTGSSTTASSASGSASPSATSTAAQLTRCQAAWRGIGQVLQAAEPAMRQWQTHIAAMNQLVAGKITLAQANEFWNTTRAGAHRRYDQFAGQDRQLRRSDAEHGCPTPPATSATTTALTGCERAVAAAAATLAAARTTLARWSEHITDMDRLRSGMLNPTMAQQMWLSMWRQGEREVQVYLQRQKAAATLRCPS
jgi:hypothetical protein